MVVHGSFPGEVDVPQHILMLLLRFPIGMHTLSVYLPCGSRRRFHTNMNWGRLSHELLTFL